MAVAYYTFTDEAGQYQKNPSERFQRAHPFYVRSYALISIDDYQVLQEEIGLLNREAEIPCGEEIKWSDAWNCEKGKSRTTTIQKLGREGVLEYCRKFLKNVADKGSVKYVLTITSNVEPFHVRINDNDAIRFSFEDAIERVQFEMQKQNGFTTFIMDESDKEFEKYIKEKCSEFSKKGTFVKKCSNLYQGILTESSSLSVGVQLADYVAGITNGCLKRAFLYSQSSNFADSVELFREYVYPKLRRANDTLWGTGIKETPTSDSFRCALQDKLPVLFKQECVIANT
ncbi:MAG: DUF3800 domain-containing protein [Thermoguttaceae bacterium]|nr:DUF3800 domain-containing protein [Thermoguttaceae bacterium]